MTTKMRASDLYFEKEFDLIKPKINWADLYVMFQDRLRRPWTNHSPRPHPCGCQVLFSEEMEIDLEDKWWLQLEERTTHSVLLKKEKKPIHFPVRVARRGFALCH